MKFLTPLLALFLIPQLALSPVWAQVPSAAVDLQIRLVEGDDSSMVNSHCVKGFTIELTGKDGTPVAGTAVIFRLPDNGATGAFADGSHALVAYTDAHGRASASGIQWSGTPGAVTLKITTANGTEHAALRVERNLKPLVDSTQPLSTALVAAAPAVPATLPQATAAPEVKPAAAAIPGNSLGPRVAQAAADSKPQSPGDVPPVSITNSSSGAASHSGNAKKWAIIAVVAAGVGIGAVMAMKGMGGHGASTPASSLSIGSPTISVGH